MAARNFPTFATDPTDSGAGTLDAKEYAALVASNGNFALENAAVTVAHTGGGSANAIATTTDPAITAYAADQTFWLVPTADNTGAVTIVRDGLATRAVVDKAGDALTGGELVTGNTYLMWDNGTHIRIMTPDASSSGGGGASFTRVINADLDSQTLCAFFDNGNDVDALKLYPDAGTFSAGEITMWAR
jgi:hypothetical protein